MKYSSYKANKYSFRLIIVIICLYAVCVWQNFSEELGFNLFFSILTFITLIAILVLYFFGQIVGRISLAIGFTMGASIIGMLFSNELMGQNFHWGHKYIFNAFKSLIGLELGDYSSYSGPFAFLLFLCLIPFIWLGYFVALSIDEVEKRDSKAKAIEQEREARYAEEEARRPQLLSGRRVFSMCPTCFNSNTAKTGVYLPYVVQCRNCGSFGCARCTRKTAIMKAAICPRCSSDDMKDVGRIG